MSKRTRPISTCVGSINVNDVFYHHRLFFRDDDRVEVFLSNDESIGLVYTCTSSVLYKGETIGRVRYPYEEEDTTMKMVLYQEGTEVIINSDVDHTDVEAFIQSELFFTRYLIENNIILSDSI